MARPKGTHAGNVSKAEMVRTALAELGAKAKPTPIQAFIKERFNQDISKIIISNYKSTMKKKGKKRGRPPGSGKKPGAAGSTGGKGLSFEDLATVRKLVGRLGAGQVHQLVDVLS